MTRGHNEGTISKRTDGRWQARVTLPDGRRQTMYSKTREEAGRKLIAALKDTQEGVPVINERQQLSAYLEDWLTAVRPSLKASSVRRYELAIRNHIAPAIGKVRLAQLSPQHVQTLEAALLDKGLSAATVNHVHNVLRAGLSQAERWGRVHRNVARLVSPPRIPRYKMATLSPQEAQRLMAAAANEPLGALFILLLSTGVRVGEALACCWSAVDLDRGTLQVTATLSRISGGYELTDPKTENAHRQVLLPTAAAAALRAHRARQNEARLHAGAAWQSGDFIFADALGQTVNPDGIVRRTWKALLVKAELPDRRLHDLRHTAATLLLGQGIHAKIVSEQLGHSSIAMTLNRYSHVTPTMQQQAVEAMNRVLGG
jgi:integrase